MSDRNLDMAYFGGIAIGIIATVVVMVLLMRMHTAHGWCDGIAQDSVEPYKVTYDRCMADAVARREKGIW